MGPAEASAATAAAAQPVASMAVELALCHLPGQCELVTLTVPAGASAADALRAAGLAQRMSPALLDSLSLSLWGRACALDQPLAHGDRLALTRALLVDPKEARRQRYQRDGVRKPVRQRVKRADRPGQPTSAPGKPSAAV